MKIRQSSLLPFGDDTWAIPKYRLTGMARIFPSCAQKSLLVVLLPSHTSVLAQSQGRCSLNSCGDRRWEQCLLPPGSVRGASPALVNTKAVLDVPSSPHMQGSPHCSAPSKLAVQTVCRTQVWHCQTNLRLAWASWDRQPG